ncbi:MAG: tripartite tricarboxylate transporter permease [Inquilinus sp.]|nr:tripartite tricarboxylate transporter permease [Inquilinus sp.]
MDIGMLDAAGQAFVAMMEPSRLLFLFAGVLLGLVIGIIPGVGGVAGMALLLPFTFGMDAYAAFAFLLGLGAVTSTSDTIPAVLFGVPGTSASQATVIDGHAMAVRGEAGRALSAAYVSSLLGGLFGALLLGLTIPALRPIILYLGSPELLACAVFGISMVAVLSGSAPLRGLAAAGIGILLSMIGGDPQTGTLRWTMDSLYLYDGLPLLPVALGIFALPELCDLAIRRTAIADKTRYNLRAGMAHGARDAFRNWWLVLRCGGLGAAIGAIPGLGSAVVDWFAYGHAIRTVPDAATTFGKGDVRGVIAPEAANNAKEGGALVPTIAFGVPGSASMAILLGAFLIHGLQPGPRMLTEHLDVTYAMVWSIALANILGAGLCFLFSGWFAKLATLRYTLILPAVLSVLYVGAFQGSRDWGDLYALLFFGVLGWTMKQLRWPRPPLILGFVLGAIIERYMFISVARYDFDWLTRPVVVVLLALSAIGLARPLIGEAVARHRATRTGPLLGRPTLRPSDLIYAVLLVTVGGLLIQAGGWEFEARMVPVVVGWVTLAALALGLLNQIFRRSLAMPAAGGGRGRETIHMDLKADHAALGTRRVLARAGLFFGWLVAFMASMAAIGLMPTAVLFVVAYMRLEAREPWRLVLPQAVVLIAFIYAVFDRFLAIPWPATLLGRLVPALKVIPSI